MVVENEGRKRVQVVREERESEKESVCSEREGRE